MYSVQYFELQKSTSSTDRGGMSHLSHIFSSYPTLKVLSERRPDIPIYVGDTSRPVFWLVEMELSLTHYIYCWKLSFVLCFKFMVMHHLSAYLSVLMQQVFGAKPSQAYQHQHCLFWCLAKCESLPLTSGQLSNFDIRKCKALSISIMPMWNENTFKRICFKHKLL